MEIKSRAEQGFQMIKEATLDLLRLGPAKASDLGKQLGLHDSKRKGAEWVRCVDRPRALNQRRCRRIR
jgi:hypothetical protein